jgi:hypothetical protein
MRNAIRLAAGAAILLAGAVAMGSGARADDAGVKAGQLTCNVASGWGFVFGSSRSLRCTYSPKPGVNEHYTGRISKFGVDIGYTQAGVIVWVVVAPTTDLAPGALAGHYGGVTAGATVGAGLGANVLIGGSNKSIALQPLSLEGNQGLNIAAGIAEIALVHKP